METGGGSNAGATVVLREDPDMEQLPPALQQLLDELSSSDPSRPPLEDLELPQLGSAKFEPFFVWDVKDMAEKTERYWQVRLQLLAAIGRCSSLKRIKLCEIQRLEEANVVLAGLLHNPVLEELTLYGSPSVGTEDCCEALGQIVSTSRTLQVLDLRENGIGREGLAHIASAVRANPNCPLRFLDLSGNHDLGFSGGEENPVVDIISCATSLRQVNINYVGWDILPARGMVKALAHNSTLEELGLGGFDRGGLSILVQGLADQIAEQGTGQIGLKVLSLFDVRCEKSQATNFFRALRKNTTLVELAIHSWDTGFDDDVLKVLLESLDVNTTLRTLRLWQRKHGKHVLMDFFRALGKNITLETLDITGCAHLDDELFKVLLESLDSNSTLRTMIVRNTRWEEEGKDALLKAALKRNAQQVAYMPMLQDNLKCVQPNAGRVFLCGAPSAGKTTLRRTMVRCHKKRSWSQVKRFICSDILLEHLCFNHSCVKWNSTKGIEVEVLTNDSQMQIAIWDLAGQDEFRVLHDFLFPSRNQAYMFAFVYSPFKDDIHLPKTAVEVEEEIAGQLLFWLQFIASNVKTTTRTCPQVLVVLTHLDRMGCDASTILDWVMPKIASLREQFRGRVDVLDNIHVVDSYSHKSVRPLVSQVFDCFKELLSMKLFAVPQACAHMSVVLTDWASKNVLQPVIEFSTLETLCRKEVKELDKFAGDQESSIKLIDAIASYLHDVGNIIHFKKFKLIVINPNWITHDFLSGLIRPGATILPSTTQGFVTEHSILEVLTNRFIKHTKHFGFNNGDLLNMMLDLELCYKAVFGDPPRAGFFVPITIQDTDPRALEGQRQLTWPYENLKTESRGKSFYYGRRLQCGDYHRTFLTPGFFPRFQVLLRNNLFSKPLLNLQDYQYTYGCNLITIDVDGMEILVESSGSGHIGDYIDVLVQSCQSRMVTTNFVREHVLEELKDFCASPKECPGVELVESIVRPYCVQNLTLCARRRNQAVKKDELQKRLLYEEINKTRTPNGWMVMAADTLCVQQAWPSIVGVNDSKGSDPAHDLLDPRDLDEVMCRNETFFQQQLASIQEAADMVLPAKKSTLDEHKTSSTSFQTDAVGSGTGLQPINSSKLLLKRILDSQEQLISMVEQQKHLLETRCNSLVTKMDEIMGYSVELQKAKMPRRPFFSTDDVDFLQRFAAGVHIGKAVRLHLMCEERAGNHVVADQVGHQIIVQDANRQWIRAISVNGAKLLFFLAKAGLHVAAGLGDIVPDFSGCAGAIPVTVAGQAGTVLLGQIDLQYTATSSHDANITMEKAWLSLQDLLKVKLKGRITELFGLYKVLYKEGQEPRVAWLCKACMEKGWGTGLLQPL